MPLYSLVQNTFEDLEDAGCIKITEDSVVPTMLGSMASQYYLKYMTVSMFGSNIGPDTSLEVSKTFVQKKTRFSSCSYLIWIYLFFISARCLKLLCHRFFCSYYLVPQNTTNFLWDIMRYISSVGVLKMNIFMRQEVQYMYICSSLLVFHE